ncbi:KRI1-like family C-terminal-domain-containing protein [Dichotomocladium elegans]|nr:KRI1-like family C-terminal-domain-containing protein [Dichotomocladium elegans]
MSDTETLTVHIRERENEEQDYQRPAILQEESASGSDAASESEDEAEESDSDSEDEVEDDTAALLTADVDAQILKTIAAIRSKDPRQEEVRDQAKKVTLKDYEHEVNVQYGGVVPEDKADEQPTVKTHSEEQEELKNAFKMAAEEGGDEDEEENFLQKPNLSNDSATAATAKEWQNIKENKNISEEDAFLVDFVLNRGWVDKGKPEDVKDVIDDVEDKDADEEHLDEVDRFESKYNFRFEEEGSSNIIGHARHVEGSLRRKQRKRQLQRERKKAKKEAAKKQKLEELSRMRNQKMKEIHDRLKEIQDITGNECEIHEETYFNSCCAHFLLALLAIGLDKIDLEGDFDPAKYDEQMSKLFDDEYYGGVDNEKPQWTDDIEGIEGMGEDETYGNDYYGDGDDEEIMMDADYLPGGEKYMASQKRKREDEDKDAGSDSKKESKKKFKELLDEYYSLNFEDIVGGDLPTRYKYRKIEPEDYGLTAADILLADDTELNKFVGLKQLAP